MHKSGVVTAWLALLAAAPVCAGQVTVTTEPAEVEVFQGTTRLGVTGPDGLTLELPAGPAVLAFVKPGFKRVERRVLVGDSALALTVKLPAEEPPAKAARPAAAAPARPAEPPAAGGRVRVSVPRANVRTTPSRDGEVLTTLASGTVLEVTDVEGDWAAVVVPADDKNPEREGFISLSVVRAEPAGAAAAAAAPDRPPAAEPAPAAAPAPPAEGAPRPAEAPRPAAPPARETTLERRQPAARQAARATGSPQEKGDKEVLAFANLLGFRSEGGSSGNGMVFFNLGKFITDRTEVGGGPTISLSAGGGDTTLSLGANAFYRYFLDNKGGQWFPYLGADIYFNDLTGATTIEVPGVETPGLLDRTYFQLIGGARNYLTEKLALELKASIGFAIGQPTSAQLFQGTLGFSYVF